MKRILLLFPAVFSCLVFHLQAQSGITWGPTLEVSGFGEGNLHPRIAIDGGGNPLVIWGRMSDESVFLSRLSGGSFTSPLKVNPAGMTIATQTWMGPDMASEGDTIYVVVKETPEVADTSHVYLLRSTDGGMTFDPPVRVENIADSISRFPTVTTDDAGNPLVGFMKINPAFDEARWVVSKSIDYGSSFSADALASGWSGGSVCDCCPGAIVSSGSNVAMLYRDANANIRDTWAGLSNDGGLTFTGGVNIDQGNWMLMMCPSSGPDGVMIDDTLISTYMSGATGTNRVYVSKTPLAVPSPSTGTLISDAAPTLIGQNFPRMASSGTAVAVAWRESISGFTPLAVSFTHDISRGLPSSFDTVADDATENADIAMTDGKIFVVWQDNYAGMVKFKEGTYAPLTQTAPESEPFHFSMSPNPASVVLILSTANNIDGEGSCTITDLSGRIILSEQLSFRNHTTELAVSPFPDGIYFVSLLHGGMRYTQKLIIQHP